MLSTAFDYDRPWLMALEVMGANAGGGGGLTLNNLALLDV